MLRRIHNWQVPLLIAAGLLFIADFSSAQETPKASTVSDEASTRPVTVYRLDFVVRELEDGKRLNSRNFSLSARSDEWANLRLGSEVPVASGVQFQYQHVGINIDSRPEERDDGDGVLLGIRFESSSLVAPEKAKEQQGVSGPVPPVIRQVRFSGASLVTPGKPTVISTLDDVASNRRYEIAVTVTKLK